MKLDNQDVAILMKVNELAERFGLKAYDINATVEYNNKTDKTELSYNGVSYGVKEKTDAMFDALVGKGNLNTTIAGDVEEIIDALDRALAKAPGLRFRR